MTMHTPIHITLHFQNTKDKEKILKAFREEKHYIQRHDNWNSNWLPNSNNGSQKKKISSMC